jgi:hypothetical protein
MYSATYRQCFQFFARFRRTRHELSAVDLWCKQEARISAKTGCSFPQAV